MSIDIMLQKRGQHHLIAFSPLPCIPGLEAPPPACNGQILAGCHQAVAADEAAVSLAIIWRYIRRRTRCEKRRLDVN